MLEIKPNSVLAKKLSTGEETPIIAIKGDDGVSPSASVTRVEGGAEITITDKSGTSTVIVHDGGSSSDDFVEHANNTEVDTLATTSKTIISAINEVNEKAGQGGGAIIDDTTPSLTKVYSSQKVSTELETLSDAIEDLEQYKIPFAENIKF